MFILVLVIALLSRTYTLSFVMLDEKNQKIIKKIGRHQECLSNFSSSNEGFGCSDLSAFFFIQQNIFKEKKMTITFKEEVIKKIMGQIFSYIAGDLAMCTTGSSEGNISQMAVIETVAQQIYDLNKFPGNSFYKMTDEEKEEVKKYKEALNYEEEVAWMKKEVFPNSSY